MKLRKLPRTSSARVGHAFDAVDEDDRGNQVGVRTRLRPLSPCVLNGFGRLFDFLVGQVKCGLEDEQVHRESALPLGKHAEHAVV